MSHHLEIRRPDDGELLGHIVPDRSYPETFVNTYSHDGQMNFGSPFSVMGAVDLRAWAEAFAAAADELDAPSASTNPEATDAR